LELPGQRAQRACIRASRGDTTPRHTKAACKNRADGVPLREHRASSAPSAAWICASGELKRCDFSALVSSAGRAVRVPREFLDWRALLYAHSKFLHTPVAFSDRQSDLSVRLRVKSG
jgi:hypothetical protein